MGAGLRGGPAAGSLRAGRAEARTNAVVRASAVPARVVPVSRVLPVVPETLRALPLRVRGSEGRHRIRVAHSWTFLIRSLSCPAVASALGGPPQTRRSSVWITPCGLPVWWT